MCNHSNVKCLSCGAEGSPAHFLGKGKKTLSPASIAARRANALKGGRPKNVQVVKEQEVTIENSKTL